MTDKPFDRFFTPEFTLETPRVVIRPMKAEDYDVLLKLVSDSSVFEYFTRQLNDDGELKKWMDEAFEAKAAGIRMPFTVFDKDEQQVCGCTSYGNISFSDKRVEIGWTWLGPEFIGKGVNKQVKFALLSYAFGVMRMERVEAKTDVLNERSKAALIKIGMKPEGILRSHMPVHSNRRRDSLYFSMLREEWVERKRDFFPELM